MCWRALDKQVGSLKSWNCLNLNPPLAFPEPRKLEIAKLVSSVENQGIRCLERLGRISLDIVGLLLRWRLTRPQPSFELRVRGCCDIAQHLMVVISGRPGDSVSFLSFVAHSAGS
jgi:hypothetical protein